MTDTPKLRRTVVAAAAEDTVTVELECPNCHVTRTVQMTAEEHTQRLAATGRLCDPIPAFCSLHTEV